MRAALKTVGLILLGLIFVWIVCIVGWLTGLIGEVET